jgi:hypothetical protein
MLRRCQVNKLQYAPKPDLLRLEENLTITRWAGPNLARAAITVIPFVQQGDLPSAR